MSMQELPQDLLQEIQGIEPRSPEWQARAQSHIDRLTKPQGSLGRLEEVAAHLVAMQRSTPPSCAGKAVYVFAGDHGVTEEGVSAYPREVTVQMVLNFLQGGAAVNALAKTVGADLVIVDVGVAGDLPPAPGLRQAKVRRGTRNFALEPAMTYAETFEAMRVGMRLAEEAAQAGRRVVAIGEMGIGNTTSASAIASALTAADPDEVTGAGTGLAEKGVERKADVIRKALRLHRIRLGDVTSVLACLGGYEIAAMAGMAIGAARRRIAVVIDGFISTAAAAVAFALAPHSRDYMFAGHASQEPGHRVLLQYLGLKPLLSLDMRLGEGSGAVLAFGILEGAVRVYNEMATFASAGVSEKSE
jgi:nicotinate-nucleotide--dimethylbenzimidazole phosphoribosyltransferase